MTHAAAGRSSHSSDKRCNRFFAIRFDPLGSFFLGRAADFSDQDHRFCVSIFVEKFYAIQMRETSYRIAADADAGRLAVAARSQLPHCFVGQRSRPRDYTDAARLVNVTRHDADLALARRDDSRTIRSDQSRALAAHLRFHTHHVHHRNSFGDADHKIDIGVHRFQN